MTDVAWIQEKLEKYSSLFDLYMEQENPPIPPPLEGSDDPLLDYLQEAVLEPFNWLHSKEDTTWREVFKSSLMGFFTAMLKDFFPLEHELQTEMALIQSFFDATIGEKEQQWEYIVSFIQEKYTSYELNPYGYLSQLEGGNQEQQESVFEAMRQQWIDVSFKSLLNSERKHIQENCQEFQLSFLDIGNEDYETLFTSQSILYEYPILKEILESIGREKPLDKEEKDTTVTRYIPKILSHSAFLTEVDGVSIGNTIQQALPSELVYLADKDTEDVFFHRFAIRKLQQLASKAPTTSEEKTENSRIEKPRLKMGPIIVSVDTSGSMSGKPIKVATSLLLQLIQMARRQKRACYLITYSVRAKAIDLAHPANWRTVKKFLREGFSGGTDGNEMLREAIATLQSKQYSMADVLIISDFEWFRPEKQVMANIRHEQTLGTKFYALGINAHGWQKEHDWIDKMWNIDRL
jgi:uncharacterized protein with von Willebrand factor type A (vWA) domain